MIILAIETSCDDTGVALLDIKGDKIKIIADFVSSQNAIHAPFGGVVPNLAVRAHYKNLPILLEKAFIKSKTTHSTSSVRGFGIQSKEIRTGSFYSPNLVFSPCSKIDLVAATNGPGLEPCLWAGINTAKVLARALDKPMVGVNHLEGHISVNWLKPIHGISNFEFRISNKNSKLIQNLKLKIKNSKLLFPAVCLIVSGGHTQLVLMKDFNKYEIIGQTRDDAAGEAFDKVAKMLGLKYPGGPEIALNAKNGDSKAFGLPRPMIDSNDYDFSFSGLKTAVRYLLNNINIDSRFRGNDRRSGGNDPSTRFAEAPARRAGSGHSKREGGNSKLVFDICASFQQAVIDVLIDKTIRAGREYKVKTIMLAGGVAANQELRKQMEKAIRKNLPSTICHLPSAKYCADNAVMIGLAGYWKFMRQGKRDRIEKIKVEANLNF